MFCRQPLRSDLSISLPASVSSHVDTSPGHSLCTGWLAGGQDKAVITSGLHLGRSGVLRNLRHYLRAQSQGHTIDHLEERGVGRGSAGRSSLKGRERAIVSQTNIGTVSKATLGKLLRRGGAHNHGLSRARVCHLELN